MKKNAIYQFLAITFLLAIPYQACSKEIITREDDNIVVKEETIKINLKDVPEEVPTDKAIMLFEKKIPNWETPKTEHLVSFRFFPIPTGEYKEVSDSYSFSEGKFQKSKVEGKITSSLSFFLIGAIISLILGFIFSSYMLRDNILAARKLYITYAAVYALAFILNGTLGKANVFPALYFAPFICSTVILRKSFNDAHMYMLTSLLTGTCIVVFMLITFGLTIMSIETDVFGHASRCIILFLTSALIIHTITCLTRRSAVP